jgi:outer membrane protein
MMEDAHIVDKQDYGYGVALTIPIFDGFKTKNGVKSAEQEVNHQERMVDDSRYRIDLANAKYDQIIESSKGRAADLVEESDNTSIAFNVAKKRYLAVQGSLLDLREAIRDLASVQNSLIEAKTDYWFALTEKAVFNGGRFNEGGE